MKHKIVKRGKCSFCEANKKLLIKSVSGESICSTCLTKINYILADDAPIGAVRCFACLSWDGFTSEYRNATVRYSVAGIDQDGRIEYVPVEINGHWKRYPVVKPKKCTCNRCKRQIPVDVLEVLSG